jgi:hypothetical protein
MAIRRKLNLYNCELSVDTVPNRGFVLRYCDPVTASADS